MFFPIYIGRKEMSAVSRLCEMCASITSCRITNTLNLDLRQCVFYFTVDFIDMEDVDFGGVVRIVIINK